ncbi:MAG TPA: N-acetyltransferase [Myxococcales bacterium]|nr:N-acetyltransferase [Myxococcales bacterium]
MATPAEVAGREFDEAPRARSAAVVQPEIPAPYQTDVVVEPARSAADRDRFVKFQWEVYKDDPHWVPPLFMERRDFVDPARHPFFHHGHVELFLAKRYGQVVGRIAAIDDPRYNEFHGTKVGHFGLFECVDDPEVAAALLDAAAAWLRARGLTELDGPIDYSSNYQIGLLVDGFDQDPYVMMPYNPRYYEGLLTGAGLHKVKDLWAFSLDVTKDPDPKVARIADKIRLKEGITVRPVNMKDFDGEVARIKTVYNAAWEKNWGFVPFTDEEFAHLAKDMKAIVKPELLLLAEVKGEPVAFAMTLPDANRVLKRVGGRLFPTGLFKALYWGNKIDRARLITLGIVEGYRRRGLDAILTLETLRAGRRQGYQTGEISWTLEDNHLINRAIQSFGGVRSKTYRVYGRPL